MSGSRRRAEIKGRRGETLASWYLRAKGWRILARRVKTPRGEIDIVARRFGTLAFIEVKWRKTVTERDRAIDRYRLRRVAEAAEVAAARFGKDGEDLRVDVVLLTPKRWPRHIANAWMG